MKALFNWLSLLAIFVAAVFVADRFPSLIHQTGADERSVNGRSKSQESKPSFREQIEKADTADLQPNGELAEMFSMGNDYTNLQRELKFKEIKGKVIKWRLPVYEVGRSGDGYRISTSSHFRSFEGRERLVEVFADITVESDVERRLIERLKTGDAITVKGVISGVTMRTLNINPAILMIELTTSKQIKPDGA